MHRLEAGIQSSDSRICGYGGQKPGISLWADGRFSHTPINTPHISRVELFVFTPIPTQVGKKLWTYSSQYYAMITSVFCQLVHTFHSAYKEHDNLKKGII